MRRMAAMKCIHAKLTNGLCILIAWCLVVILTGAVRAESTLDTARCSSDTNDVYLISPSTIEILAGTFYRFGSLNTYHRYFGLRFYDITIPQGSVIDSAFLQFTANGSLTDDNCNVRFFCEDTASASNFLNDTYSIFMNDRKRTTNYADWSAMADWTSDVTYMSPDIKSPVQEVVNRADWASDNELVIICEDNSSSSGAYRQAWTHYGSGSKSAKLYIYWSEGTPAGATATKRVGVRK